MNALWANDDGSATVYMCATDWQYEVSGNADGNRVFPSLGCAQENLKCWKSCGIVGVRMEFKRIALEGTDPT